MQKLFNCKCGNRFPADVSENPAGETIECEGCGENRTILVCDSCENIVAEEYSSEDCPVCGSPLSTGGFGCSFVFLSVFIVLGLLLILPFV